MEIERRNLKKMYELLPEKGNSTFKASIIKKSRVLIGRAENCDIIIKDSSVSSIHAIIEVNLGNIKIYDMNSTNGTYINGKKIIVGDIKVGDTLSFAKFSLSFKDYRVEDLPPILDLLDPETGHDVPLSKMPAEIKDRLDIKATLPKGLPESPDISDSDVPYIVYPLAADPKAEFSEYIFEDIESLYPIFKYRMGADAVEVMILHNESIYSVDYLPNKNGSYKIVGNDSRKDEIEYPYLAKNQKHELVEVRNGEYFVHNLFGYEILHLTDDKVKVLPDKNELITLAPNDIIKFSKQNLEIYIRRASSPPVVASAPLLGRDKNLLKYILISLGFLLLAFFFFNNFKIDEELDQDKIPERIATILYKEKFIISKKNAVKKTVKKKKVAQKSPKKAQTKNEKKRKNKPKKISKAQNKTSKKTDPGKKTAKVKRPTKKLNAQKSDKARAAKNPGKIKNRAKGPSVAKSANRKPRKSNVKSRHKGTVQAYKSLSFKSTISSNLAKGGSFKAASQNAASAMSNNTSFKTGNGIVKSATRADIATDVGTLTGSTGKVSTTRGAEGLSFKKSIYTAGIPAETVVLGSMDPDIIRRILREHLPQFQSCYQKELDRSGNNKSRGRVHTNFVIGASGHVTHASINKSSLPGSVKRCIANVIRGIRFPRPLGGGTVEVNQPFNLYQGKI